jgi:hypothetical protein
VTHLGVPRSLLVRTAVEAASVVSIELNISTLPWVRVLIRHPLTTQKVMRKSPALLSHCPVRSTESV